jgi:hypothetical protein
MAEKRRKKSPHKVLETIDPTAAPAKNTRLPKQAHLRTPEANQATSSEATGNGVVAANVPQTAPPEGEGAAVSAKSNGRTKKRAAQRPPAGAPEFSVGDGASTRKAATPEAVGLPAEPDTIGEAILLADGKQAVALCDQPAQLQVSRADVPAVRNGNSALFSPWFFGPLTVFELARSGAQTVGLYAALARTALAWQRAALRELSVFGLR